MESLREKRIVLTRADGQSAELALMLRAAGADPIIYPTIQIAPLADYSALDAVLQGLNRYAWIVFTSPHAAKVVLERTTLLAHDDRLLSGTKIAAAGTQTLAELHRFDLPIMLAHDDYQPGKFAHAILAQNISRSHLLLPRVETDRVLLRQLLLEGGAFVHEIAVYRAIIASPDVRARLQFRQGFHAILFTSSITVRNLFTLHGEDVSLRVSDAKVVCIGPLTAQTAHDHGLHVDAISPSPTARGLFETLQNLFL